MRIAFIAKPGHENTGVGRYTYQLRAAMEGLGHEVLVIHPAVPFPGWLVRTVRRLFGWDLQAFFETYPVWARYPPADIYHITSQNLATLLVFRQPACPTIVTVHDIIPLITRRNKEISSYKHVIDALFDRIAMRGLARAVGWIAVSEFTKQTLVDELGYRPERIIVVHEGIG